MEMMIRLKICNIISVKMKNSLYFISAHIDDSPKQVIPPMVLEDTIITSEKQKKKMEKELKSKQKEIAKQEKKEKEREEKEIKAKAKEEKKKEKLEKKSAARSNMKANSVQGQPSMEDFRSVREFVVVDINNVLSPGRVTRTLSPCF